MDLRMFEKPLRTQSDSNKKFLNWNYHKDPIPNMPINSFCFLRLVQMTDINVLKPVLIKATGVYVCMYVCMYVCKKTLSLCMNVIKCLFSFKI